MSSLSCKRDCLIDWRVWPASSISSFSNNKNKTFDLLLFISSTITSLLASFFVTQLISSLRIITDGSFISSIRSNKIEIKLALLNIFLGNFLLIACCCTLSTVFFVRNTVFEAKLCASALAIVCCSIPVPPVFDINFTPRIILDIPWGIILGWCANTPIPMKD